MFFILKSAFCLAIVFLLLPDGHSDRIMGEVSRAMAQDEIVKAAVERTNLATRHVAAEAPRLCIENSGQCVEAAKQFVQNAAGRW